MITARLALTTDLPALLELFAGSEVSAAIQLRERAEIPPGFDPQADNSGN